MSPSVVIPANVICPTTGHAFAPRRYKVQQVKHRTFIWIWCSECDCFHRASTDPLYDPQQPQPHCFELSSNEDLCPECERPPMLNDVSDAFGG